jgi:two-component system KDP operon response regulator KdpE
VAIRKLLVAGLTEPNVRVIEAEDGQEGLRLAARSAPDLILLDLGLPDMDGTDLLVRLREWSQIPVIVLSARGQEADKVRALDLGADDYLMKPFSMNELLARVRVALRHRRLAETPETVYESRGLILDFERRTVHLNGTEIRLTPVEFRLLSILVRNAGRVVTHRQLLRDGWGPEFEDATHTLRVHMANLRHKIEPNATKPIFVRTETGVGYRWLTSE